MSTMSTRVQREERSVGEQAAEWLLILETGGDEERRRFSEWIAKSPLHVEAFLKASTMDTLLNRVDAGRSVRVEPLTEREMAETDIHMASEAREPPPARRHGFLPWAAVACALGIVALTIAWRWKGPSGQRLGTTVGEQRVLELADGSVLYLNTSSEAVVTYTRQERRIELLAGEAQFRVHADASRPFRVQGGGSVVQALGTQFNMRLQPGETVVSVLEGAVSVSRADAAAGDGENVIRLESGEQARVTRSGGVSAPVSADLGRIDAWRQRRLIFVDEPLASIASEFNRYNRKPKIHVEGRSAAERRYAAAFDADDPESLLEILRKDASLRVEQRADEVVVSAAD